MMRLKPRHCYDFAVIVVLPDGYICLESYIPEKKDCCLLYKLDLQGKLIWEAWDQKNLIDYENFINLAIHEEKLLVYDGSGHADVNTVNGELTNWFLER